MNFDIRVGGFPNLKGDVGLSKLRCNQMTALFNASKYDEPGLLISTLQTATDVDVNLLTDDDLRYLIAMQDRVSYTEDSRVTTWRCHAPSWERGEPGTEERERVFTNPHDNSFTKSKCNMLNTQDVRVKVKISEARSLPAGMRYPMANTLQEASELRSRNVNSALIEVARWVDSDWPLLEIINSLSLSEIAVIKKHMHSRVRVVSTLRCGVCQTVHEVDEDLSIRYFLRVYSEKSMLNMYFNLNTLFNTSIPEDQPIKTLLYHHGCYLQDKREADKKRRELEAQRKRGAR